MHKGQILKNKGQRSIKKNRGTYIYLHLFFPEKKEREQNLILLRFELNLEVVLLMSNALIMMVQSPSCFAAKKRSPPLPPRKTQRPTTSHGFGGEKKTPVWQCVENCGACCKLDKGPTFPSAEEIFDDPSDVEVYFPTLLLAQSVLCVCH